MSTAINNYSINSNSLISTAAGSDCRNHKSYDDLLLLPSLKVNSYLNGNYICSANTTTPILPRICNDTHVKRKYNTAPASPTHHNFYGNYDVTPQTSPLLVKTQLALPRPKIGTKEFRQFQTRYPKVSQDSLPSLRHLQLLPDPRIQEYAYNYPDTSECNPIWKRNLVHWCKETNYQDYTRIVDEISVERSQISSLLNNANQNDSPTNKIPSVLKPNDTFKDLSDISRDTIAPMTPPMSPNNSISEPQQVPKEFTPFVSEKLIQTVKQESAKTGPLGHRKTNSFKALQLKNLLDNRDILSSNSKPSRGIFKVGKVRSSSSPSSSSSSVSTPTPLSIVSSRSRINIYNAATQLVARLDNQDRHHEGPNSTNLIDASAIAATSPIVSRQERSRSISPIRPSTPPSSSSASKYHRFALDSPQSPVVTTINKNFSSSTKTSLVRRRSSGSNSNVIRKCVSCHSTDSPCWRPSWSGKRQDQLCNSCGLRYKKTHTRCLNESCRKIPTKGELSIMKSNGISRKQNLDGSVSEGYTCLFCNSMTDTTTDLEKGTDMHAHDHHQHSLT